MADRKIKMSEALFNIINLCGLSSVGVKKGLKKSLLRVAKAGAFIQFNQLFQDGTGFEAGAHPAVLVIKRQGKTDKSVLSVVGNPEEAVVFDLDKAPTPDPLANIVAFPPKTERPDSMTVETPRERHPDEALFEPDREPASAVVEAFERQFSQEEAEQISEGFDGDVRRASRLYKELTEGYVSTMTVDDLIKAGTLGAETGEG
jgi:hypothetical protein